MWHPFGFRNVAARECREFFLHDDERSQEHRVVRTDRALREIAEDYFPLVHRRPEVKARSRLADHCAEQGISRKGTALVEHRGDRFFPKPVFPAVKSISEKIEYGRILSVAEHVR